MDAKFMTASELRTLAEEKEKENKPIKIGYLKHDVFLVYNREHAVIFDDFVISKQDLKETIKKFLETFHNSIDKIEKGAKFECFLFDGIEYWYDIENKGVDEMESDWAEKHLERIKNC